MSLDLLVFIITAAKESSLRRYGTVEWLSVKSLQWSQLYPPIVLTATASVEIDGTM